MAPTRRPELLVGWCARQWLIHAPTERGKSFIMRSVLPRLSPDAADFTVDAPGGGRVRARLTESTGLALMRGVDVEAAEIAWALALVTPGATVMDAGANVGLFTIPVARAVGPTGSVVAFEPAPETVRRLRRSIAINGLQNVRVVESAVGDVEESVDFVLAADSAYSGLQPDPRSPPQGRATVPMVMIDHAWASLGQPSVTLLKLDVEGAELRALRGAEDLLRSCRPVLLVEASTEAHLTAITEWLASRGYSIQTPDGFRPYNHVFEHADSS
jgi:FkbM family methyltransferase